jgi:tetratricopeptide (TPR) repeat protein
MTDSLGRALLPKALREQLGEDILYCFDREIWDEIHPKLDPFTKLVMESADLDELTDQSILEQYQKEADSSDKTRVKLNNLGVIQYRLGMYEAAAKSLKKALLAGENSQSLPISPAEVAARSPILFNLGLVYLSQADSWERELADTLSVARHYLDSALQADYLSLRIKQPYLDQLEQFRNVEQVTLVDLPELFLANGGERLFVDHCHPTAAGHLLIAEKLLRVIIEKNLVR